MGKVTHNGKPAAGLMAKLFHKALRREELLGEASTDSAGQYQVPYKAEQLSSGGNTHPNLLVRVYNAAGKELAVSGIRYSAPPRATINITLPPGAAVAFSRYEELQAGRFTPAMGCTIT